MYTKFIIVTDDDINIRDWKEVIWRVDPARDTLIADNTPIDYRRFRESNGGLGSKMGIDATNKWPAETARQWGRPDYDGSRGDGACRCAMEEPGTVIGKNSRGRPGYIDDGVRFG